MGAPLPPVTDVAKLVVRMSQQSHISQNVWHIGWSSGVSSTSDMEALAKNLYNAYQILFDGTGTAGHTYISSDSSLESVTAIDLTSSTAPFYIFSAAPYPGAATQKSVNNSAVLIHKPVHRRFRGGHARTYLAGVTGDNSLDGRLWIPALVTDFTAWIAGWASNLETGFPYTYPNIGGLQFYQVSYYDRAVNPVPPYRRAVPLVDSTPWPDWDIDPVIRSQRRRVRNTPTPT